MSAVLIAVGFLFTGGFVGILIGLWLGAYLTGSHIGKEFAKVVNSLPESERPIALRLVKEYLK